LRHEVLHNLYFSPNITRVIKSRKREWAVHVSCMEETRNACRILIGKHEGKRPLWRRGRTWEDNIRMCPKELDLTG
jgi:hypothetical protein